MKPYRNPVNGRVHRDYTWCSQCEQCHATQSWDRRGWFCPAGCGASALDALPWEFVRQMHPDYPEVPTAGRNYVWHVHHAPQSTPAPERDRQTDSGMAFSRSRVLAGRSR